MIPFIVRDSEINTVGFAELNASPLHQLLEKAVSCSTNTQSEVRSRTDLPPEHEGGSGTKWNKSRMSSRTDKL